ncbi:WXG100 family type VII secretion target [Acetivibrio straminisolvens]|jgi:WXG100 family type VII secretion target|uniref:ESAT-6-like protein n=1 Tax=Acetivibrio straminisolvens JCM 21531 TaxID=1294263 RepID=W4V151_9FIRM|nr:WXG100 family type VII secretion target [Acetivibrio straminisolvens]GAE86936.1 hypothetical protein JCM21531_270 [Acetivibrio straminisolvens JCM 21531]
MANVIRITPVEVRNSARRIKDKSTEARIFLDTVQKEIDSLKSIWEGKAAQAYVDQFIALRKELEGKLNKCLEDLQLSLNSVADALEQADQEIANKLRK